LVTFHFYTIIFFKHFTHTHTHTYIVAHIIVYTDSQTSFVHERKKPKISEGPFIKRCIKLEVEAAYYDID